jgi:hypothetical protein
MSDASDLPPLTAVDQAMLHAARAWGRDVAPGYWRLFRTDRQTALRMAWENDPPGDPAASLEFLKRAHAAQARPDLARVHVSWWSRALQDEPRSVRAAVVANLPPGIADALREAVHLGRDELTPDRPADPLALRAALSLWSERLVGDLPDPDGDPPVVAALAGLDSRAAVRLVRSAGLAKLSITSVPLPGSEPDDHDLSARLRSLIPNPESSFVAIATRDIVALGSVRGTHPEDRLGLTTVARLLDQLDPHRVRWVLQHVPYSTARAIRGLMSQSGRRTPTLAGWEEGVLRAAWVVLHQEGWISEAWRWETRP